MSHTCQMSLFFQFTLFSFPSEIPLLFLEFYFEISGYSRYSHFQNSNSFLYQHIWFLVATLVTILNQNTFNTSCFFCCIILFWKFQVTHATIVLKFIFIRLTAYLIVGRYSCYTPQPKKGPLTPRVFLLQNFIWKFQVTRATIMLQFIFIRITAYLIFGRYFCYNPQPNYVLCFLLKNVILKISSY